MAALRRCTDCAEAMRLCRGDDGRVTAERVLGVDACKSGWVGIALAGHTTTAYTAAHVDELVAAAHVDGPTQVVAMDMPIGLPDAGSRRAQPARPCGGRPAPLIGVPDPVRAALEAADHATATAVNQQATGAGVSAQAFALRHKLLEVDAWVRHAAIRVVEVHPGGQLRHASRDALVLSAQSPAEPATVLWPEEDRPDETVGLRRRCVFTGLLV